jgi:DNA-binding NarL/FixJ family response regulator
VNEKIRIVIADDHRMFRQGLNALLNLNERIKVVGEVSDGSELLLFLSNFYVDIVLLDIQMPVMNGTQALEVLKQRFPDHRIIMVSMEFNAFMLEEYFKRGAHGFIPKGCDIEVLIEAIYKVKEEGHCHNLSFKLVAQLNKHSLKPFKNKFILSPREIEVLSLTCRGNSNKEVGTMLQITERTVEFHKTNIYSKTGLKNLSDLIAYGIKNGLDVV